MSLLKLACVGFIAVFSTAGVSVAAEGQEARKQQLEKQQTFENLENAYREEAAAAERYSAFAERADADGFAQVAKLFRAASKSEAIHREKYADTIKQLGGAVPKAKSVKISIASTADNLRTAIKNQEDESQKIYPKFIAQARRTEVTAALKSFESDQKIDEGHIKLFEEAERSLSGMKRTDYHVNRASGAIRETPKGKALSASDASKFIRIG